ncbi:peptidase M61 [Gillisia sp. M10.2A]|uniref:Peptidase M61 n=1 Tax=Gillisia lutea TaxID=2909668 RepID=A0ABS9EIL5_9FLAO|nr:peptidase M61 [Gillisia lutea]MCF4102702.1 peptidase M61 [Gillisia lutea]
MKKIIYSVALLAAVVSCKPTQDLTSKGPSPVVVNMDLVNVSNDKVMVSVDPGKFTSSSTTFHIPKTVPGTYSVDNYGEFIEGIKALDYSGNELAITSLDENSWTIQDAVNLDKITYWVNDSFDMKGEKGVFSPSGSNIDKDTNFLLNLHSFVGYFDGLKENTYQLEINHPAGLIAGTAAPFIQVKSKDGKSVNDIYTAPRYFEVVDQPIMYAKPDTVQIKAEGINVLLSVYSPNKVYSAQDIKDGVEKMITAQKKFLGPITTTSNYAILLYLADPAAMDAKGYGALEHHTSTVVVLPESMPLERLNTSMTDVVSHEFFHILTPLNVHSEEIHYFDYNDPKMSKHLWMYEGVTEYFANLFQVNQGLIDNNEFYKRMVEKIESSKNFSETVPFTVMSENILDEPYKDDYYNVYLKGALIGMALDIKLRELSNGKSGILDLMQQLSEKYGKDKPFKDDELIPAIVSLTSPEIQEFFDTYVTGENPIPYGDFFEKVGVKMADTKVTTSFFINGQVPYIDGDPSTNALFFRKNIKLNSFLNEFGVKNGDIIKSVNGTSYNIQNVYDLIMKSQEWKEGDDIAMVLERDGEEMTLTGKISTPTDDKMTLTEMELPENDSKVQLRKAWLLD